MHIVKQLQQGCRAQNIKGVIKHCTTLLTQMYLLLQLHVNELDQESLGGPLQHLIDKWQVVFFHVVSSLIWSISDKTESGQLWKNGCSLQDAKMRFQCALWGRTAVAKVIKRH